MAVYDINGNTSGVYDIDGNVIGGGGDVAPTDNVSGYVTDPEYITVENSPYRLVWHDEFEGSDINKNFWTDAQLISTKYKRYGAWTDYYLNDSKLHLRIKKDAPNCFVDDPSNSNDMAQSIIQTAQQNKLHVTTYGYHDVNPFWGLLTQEGYYECRFKVWKATGGCHTSWWCVGIQDGLYAESARAEIDITEILGRATTNLPHGQHRQSDASCTESYTTTEVNVDFATDFHTVGFLWENGLMKWYVDGTLVDTKNINTPQYPVMHFLAAYKRRSGSGWTGAADTTLGDVEFQVDYLRIYKKATSQASNTVTISGYTPITINANTQDMTIDDERGCPICFPSYVYVNWSDGTRTEHWVKWQAVQETYQSKMTNQQSFTWDGYVYGLGIDIVAQVNY